LLHNSVGTVITHFLFSTVPVLIYYHTVREISNNSFFSVRSRDLFSLKLDNLTSKSKQLQLDPRLLDPGTASVCPAAENSVSPVTESRVEVPQPSQSPRINVENVPKESEIHCVMPSKTSPRDLNAVLKKLSIVEESRSRLKEKTKLLLRQYRDKRSLLERRERQLMSQRAGLEQLQRLLRSQNSCQLLVLRHTASHLREVARLLAALLPEREPPPHLSEENIFNCLFIIFFFFLPYFPSYTVSCNYNAAVGLIEAWKQICQYLPVYKS
jgi:hypothetical protein